MTADDAAKAAVTAFDQALITRDFAALRTALADGFVMINPLGRLLDRAGWLAWIEADITYHEIVRSQQQYRAYGEAMIVTSAVRSTMSVRGYLDGRPSLHRTVRTDVWVRQSGRLQLTLVHLTRPEETG